MLPSVNTTPPGASNLPNGENTGTGAVAQASTVEPVTAVDSAMPLKRPKKDTSTIKPLDAGQELEIFQSTFSRLIRAGIALRVAEFYDTGTTCVIVVLENCKLITTDGKKRIVPL